jgi:hypothetical protein
LKLTPYAESVDVSVGDGGVISTRSDINLGAALFVFGVDGK